MVAAAYFVVCMFASLLLWSCGLWSIGAWCRWRLREGQKQSEETGGHLVGEGEEKDPLWRFARTLAKARNYALPEMRVSGHYNVAPLLKITTGLSMDDLAAEVRVDRCNNSKSMPRHGSFDRKG